jgi:lipopolysaccharide export system permease protein
MIKLIDRQMIRGYFKSYAVCLVSLLSLYVVVDLFTNLDAFVKQGQGLTATVRHIGIYYGCQVFLIFDRLCEVIVLLAGMFTVAWMQRNNEQLPLLSAGVSTRRIVMPVLVCSAFMLSLAVLNQEFVLPRLAGQLSLDRDDPTGDKEQSVKGQFEPNLIHFTGVKASRLRQSVREFQVTIPEAVIGHPYHLTAAEARYTRMGPRLNRWELIGCRPGDLDQRDWDPKLLEVKDVGRYVIYTREVDFEKLTRNPNWFLLASTSRLYQELYRPESTRQGAVAVLFQQRVTRPLLGMLLVLMGLSMILRDQNRNVFLSAGSCLVLCGVFFVVCYCCKMLGDNDILSPALAAWLPVLMFGPFAFVLFDAVHT